MDPHRCYVRDVHYRGKSVHVAPQCWYFDSDFIACHLHSAVQATECCMTLSFLYSFCVLLP